jgi:hypothetical protein
MNIDEDLKPKLNWFIHKIGFAWQNMCASVNDGWIQKLINKSAMSFSQPVLYGEMFIQHLTRIQIFVMYRLLLSGRSMIYDFYLSQNNYHTFAALIDIFVFS